MRAVVTGSSAHPHSLQTAGSGGSGGSVSGTGWVSWGINICKARDMHAPIRLRFKNTPIIMQTFDYSGRPLEDEPTTRLSVLWDVFLASTLNKCSR